MKDANAEKLQMISDLCEVSLMNYIGLPTSLLAHGVLNTFKLFDLVKIYINSHTGSKIIAGNILKRLPDEKEVAPIYEYVFNSLKEAPYIERLRLRKLLEAMLDKLDEVFHLEFFSYFYRSSYIYEIRAALTVSKSIWNEQIRAIILEDYYRSLDLNLLAILVEKSEQEEVIELAPKAWVRSLPNYLKVLFIRKLKGSSIENLLFLINVDPGNFLVLIRYANQQVTDELIIDCYNRIPERYRPFAIWNLGKLGRWHLIKPYIQEFIDAPIGVFKGFSDVIFE